MRFLFYAFLAVLSAWPHIHHVHAGKTTRKVKAYTRHSGKMLHVLQDKPIQLIDDDKQIWNCDESMRERLLAGGYTIKTAVTFKKRENSLNTAYDVYKVWSEGTVFYVKPDGSAVTLYDPESEEKIACEKPNDVIKLGVQTGTRVGFRRKGTSGEDVAFGVMKLK